MGLTRLESYQYTWNKMVRLIYEEKKSLKPSSSSCDINTR